MRSLTEQRQRLQGFKKNIRLASSSQDPAMRMIQTVIQRAENRRADELAAAIKALKKEKTSSQTEKPFFHTLIIKPVGNRCNLQCRYCFNLPDAGIEDEGNSALTVMCENVLRKIIFEALNAGPECLHFVWHGGEPLLAGISFFESAVSLQKEMNLEGKTINNSVQTNGTLINDQWISFFKRNDFSISISLDGPEAVHNRYRRYASGEGSFSYVQRAIQSLQDCAMNFGVITVIAAHIPITHQEIFHDFIGRGIYNFGISPCCCPGDMNISPKDYADFSMGLFDVWLSGGLTGVQINPFEDIVAGLFGYPSRLCWMRGICPMFISIELNGDVWPCCDRTLPSETYCWGNILDMDLSFILKSRNAHDFLAAHDKRQSLCMDCQWAFLCQGGCVYNRVIHTGAVDGRDPLCPAYHEIFGHIADRIDEAIFF